LGCLLEAFAFCFWAFGFWLFDVKGKELSKGKGLLKGQCWREIAEGKRITKGKLLKEFSKEGLIESLYQELYT
jgi:hypothetical protein